MTTLMLAFRTSCACAVLSVLPCLPLRATDQPTALPAKPAIGLAGAFPAPGAVNVCPDTPLRLTFDSPPVLGTAGKIQIHDAADDRVVETIDVISPTALKTIGGYPNFKYYPVIITGNVAAIYPLNGELACGKTYYVTIDAGVFKNGTDDYASLDQAAAWRFTTRSAPPAAGAEKYTVAADGTGDFCTVQGALDFVPEGNTKPVTIFIRKGVYNELIFLVGKDDIRLIGEDRKQTVIAYANNDKFNHNSANPYSSGGSPVMGKGNIYRRGVLLAHYVKNLVLANLTVRNTTPHGGSQAEAVILNGSPEARAYLTDLDLSSYQDTLQINGQAYVSNCYIEGDVDFMWGTGPCFFENCICRSLNSTVAKGGYYTQIRNPPASHGYVYLHCTFDGAPGVTGNFLSRIQPVRFPESEVVLLDCVLTDAVGGLGWFYQKNPDKEEGVVGDVSRLHFWEYHSHDASGKPIEMKQRITGARELRQPDDAALIANYSDPTWVLGHGWKPKPVQP